MKNAQSAMAKVMPEGSISLRGFASYVHVMSAQVSGNKRRYWNRSAAVSVQGQWRKRTTTKM
jgi:hypothetical protein